MIGGVVCWKRVTNAAGAPASHSSSPASRSTARSAGSGVAADVGAVDGQRRERRLEPLDARPVAPQPVDVGRERRARLLQLGLVRPRAERPRVAGELLPQRGQRRLARGIDEQRRDVVEELVADRPLDGPVAQRLAGIEDLLHPHVRGAAVAEPLEVAGRVGQAVGMVDPQPVDQALAHERQGEPVRLGEHGRILLAHAGQVVDVEEAPVPAGRRVEVEEARAPLGVGSSTGSRRRSPCGSGRCRARSRGPRRAPRPRASGGRPRRPARRRPASGRPRRSRAPSPRARRTPATGTGARRRGRAGRARAPRRPANVRSGPSCSR